MSYSPLSFLMISGSIPAAPPPRKPLSVVADLIVQPAGAVLELCCCGAPLGTAASAAQCWGTEGPRSFRYGWDVTQVLAGLGDCRPRSASFKILHPTWSRCSGLQGTERRAWCCHAFGNAGSVLSNSTVSVTCCLWQSLCAQSWSIYSIFCVLAWMFHVCIRTWRSGPKLKSS